MNISRRSMLTAGLGIPFIISPGASKIIAAPSVQSAQSIEDWAKVATILVLENLRSDTKLIYDPTLGKSNQSVVIDGSDRWVHFDNYYVAFSYKHFSVLSIEMAINVYLLPGMTTFSREINRLSPNCDSVIIRPFDQSEVVAPHTAVVTAKTNNLSISSYLSMDEKGEYTISFEMIAGFNWIRHDEDL